MKKFLYSILALIVSGSIGYFARDAWYKPAPIVIKADAASQREIISGKIVGYSEDNGTHAWLGIPYAKPPVVELRWKTPQEPDKWDGVREALTVCSVCTQYGNPLADVSKKYYGKPVGSEDCLYLNIWAPQFAPADIPQSDKRLPVMLWIHGGGNSIGHGGNYSGKYLAEKYGLIIVTINYRLGPFGWFAHPALREKSESSEDKSGNFGTLDIIFALKWVKSNIANFGGDPDNVTVFGESAGAVDTLSMMLSPKAKGLFHKAIVQSVMARVTPVEKAENYVDDKVPGHKFSSREIVSKLMIADKIVPDRQSEVKHKNQMSNEEIAKYLRKTDNYKILSAYSPGPFGMISIPTVFQDGNVIPEGNALDLFKDTKNYNSVPLIIGTNKDEYKLFMAQDPKFINRYLGIIRRFKDEKFYELFAAYKSNFWKAGGADEIAISIAQSKGEKVFCYRFDWDEEPSILGMDMAKLIGAAHGLEIPFVFNRFETSGLYRIIFTKNNKPARTELSDSMSSYWAEFAYAGSPGKGRNGKELAWNAWDNISGKSDKFIIFDTKDDGGIRMSSDIITLADFKKKFLSETSFDDQKK